jgi:hypothetical protein
MTPRALLARLRDHGVEVQAAGSELQLRGLGAPLPPDLHRAAVQQKAALLALISEPAALPACPFCRRTDYMPVDSGWRRCWSCAERWGPATAPDPGDPPGLARIRALLDTPARRQREGGAA